MLIKGDILLHWEDERYRRCVLHNHLINWRRDARRNAYETLEEDDNTPSLDADIAMCVVGEEFWDRVERGLALLTPSQRFLIRKHLIEGYSFVELLQSPEAQQLGIGASLAAVRKAYQRARLQLRRVLERQGFDADEALSYVACQQQARGGASGIARKNTRLILSASGVYYVGR